MILSVKKVVVITLIVSLLGVAATFGLNALTFKEVSGSVEAETTYGPMKLTARLDKTIFKLGEKVNVTVTITNISNETILLGYWLPPKVDFAVYNSSSQMIFLFAKSRGWLGVLDDLVLEPLESYSHMWEWDQQKENQGHLKSVDAGTYYITGRTGWALVYLGPKDEWHESTPSERIVVETPEIKIQIL